MGTLTVRFIFFILIGLFISGCANLPKAKEEKIDKILHETIPGMEEDALKYIKKPEKARRVGSMLKALASNFKEFKEGSKPYAPEREQELDRQLTDIDNLIAIEKGKVVKSDISFPSGAYKLKQLSAEGRDVIRGFVDQIKQTSEGWQKLSPGKPTVTISIAGYTDSVGFKYNLIRELESQSSTRLPSGSVPRRQVLNRILSRLRAETIRDFIRSYAGKIGMGAINFEVEGRGEEYPEPGIIYDDKDDERRRITRISADVDVR